MQRIHIVGSGPRSGTTLIFEMIAASYDVSAVGHEVSVTKFFEAEGGKPVLTKEPAEMDRARLRLKTDPRLFAIFIMRDPRDVVTSRHKQAPDKFWSTFYLWRSSVFEFERAADHPRLAMVRYEDLVSDPDMVQIEIEKKLPFLTSKTGADRDQFSTFADRADPTKSAVRALGGVRAVDASRAQRWRGEMGRVAQQVDEFPDFPDYLVKYGYETDRKWLEALADVPRDLTPSHWTEENLHSPMKALRYRVRGVIAAAGALLGKLTNASRI
jgi:hypothetical protein